MDKWTRLRSCRRCALARQVVGLLVSRCHGRPSPLYFPWFGERFVPKILVYGNETAETNQGQKGWGHKLARHYWVI